MLETVLIWYAVWVVSGLCACSIACRIEWKQGSDITVEDLWKTLALSMILGPIVIIPVFIWWYTEVCEKKININKIVVFRGNKSKRVLDALQKDYSEE